MTDEQLLEEYNKEIFDFDGSGPWTMLQILAQSRQFREHSKTIEKFMQRRINWVMKEGWKRQKEIMSNLTTYAK